MIDQTLATDVYYTFKELNSVVQDYQNDISIYYDDSLDLVPYLLKASALAREIMGKCIPYVIVNWERLALDSFWRSYLFPSI